ncbi:hypothetical protein [Amycolatopsis sp. EV170708-02-1]|uniref:hypothetical protein n=1 Tax=Amycolatopsis sp. EV170708-02-1 TaxID=2919322 RepID=UPI001F0C264E|nr:hypothetical protein [Amycolatopsis sp. EV170708-02-1]UMP04676.1 hypothetical protein MJQ72_07495 [Amycolatopsis sp. EV170708-02-1]
MRAVTKVFVIVAGLITGLLGPVVPAGAATGCAEIGSGNNFDPGLVSMSDGTVDVYKTGLTGTTSRAQVDPRTNTVLGAQPLGGTSRSEPGAVSWGQGTRRCSSPAATTPFSICNSPMACPAGG